MPSTTGILPAPRGTGIVPVPSTAGIRPAACGASILLAKKPPRHRLTTPTHRSGFTLLEVIAGMALISLVIGGVYGIANGALQLGTTMTEARIKENRITRFTAQWRDYLETLPPGTVWTAPPGSTRSGSSGKLLIEGGSVPFAWQRAIRLADAVEFRVDRSDRSDDLALYIRHLKRPERATSATDYDTMAEIALLENVERLQWQFYDPTEDNEGWFSTWDPEKRPRPPLYMRLKLRFTDDPGEHEFTFWIANDLQPASRSGGTPANNPNPAQ